MTPDLQPRAAPDVVLDFSALDRMPTDQELPYEDGEPMEANWHRAAMNLLVDSLEYLWRDRRDFFVGGNMFVYFSKKRVFNKDFRGPDFFVAKGVPHDRGRLSWVVWNEGKFPDVIVELTSPSTAGIDRGEKKALYEKTFRTPEYFIYDPEAGELCGWRWSDGGYGEPLERGPGGRIWSRELELYLGPWDGTVLAHEARWPRFFDVHGFLVPTAGEAGRADVNAATAKASAAEQRAFTEARRADAAEERAAAEAAARAAAEAELARLKHELAALRPPPPSPEDRP